ncbi:putative mitochondrial hypothetical protein [Leptomonas pyrrhocoris]|uniref:Transmembrane protein n=1 Tax=Leptomonas pyrrhocoris TaxID=157538 RepID=A0A0M9G7G4_LEPPY|nr:putative mitochondrial hypothetical protein [Leptomonas pyrrhocoris]KPA84117.1 putative mitochondrial hypothetical protein [Leptomonas pyrrhocoris]|eukprot:XP_015662556.1 putative mitochondrial hypothetical protein [Leptomonas pyrrhocoris]
MGAQGRSGWGRRLYLWLTTSTRDRRNRIDDVGAPLQAARRERNKVQRVNDVFHAAGMGTSRAASLEGITLQGRGEGLAWSFLLLPACFAVGFFAFISLYHRGERRAQQLAAESAWQRQLGKAADKKAAAIAALRSAQEQSGEMKEAIRACADEDALTTKLASNLEFIKANVKPQPRWGSSDRVDR